MNFSLLADVESAFESFFSNLTSSTTFNLLFFLGIGLELFLILLFAVKSRFSYEARMRRSLDDLNRWLFRNKALDKENIKEFNKDSLLKFEKEVVGIYLSGHPLDDFIDKYKSFNLTSNMLETKENEEILEDDEINNVSYDESIKNDMKVICGGLISDVRKTVTKNGNKEMGFAKLEDLYGTIDLTVFPGPYKSLKNLLNEDTMATIKGKLNIREGEKPTVLVDEIIPWKQQKEVKDKKEKLYLKFDTTNIQLYNVITGIINSYPGNSEVLVRCCETGKAFKLNKDVSISQHLLGELLGVLDENDILIK